MGLDINLQTSKIDISEEDGINVDLYTDKLDIEESEAEDIIIEITGLKSINKFIGLEDTPLYYENGKFFKVQDNKIIYTDIEWKDITGDIDEGSALLKLINSAIKAHNENTASHPYIQDIIQNNYNILDNKIDSVENELNNAINAEIQNRIDADNALDLRIDGVLEDIQAEATTRAENDTLLQNNIDSLYDDLDAEISARETADLTLTNNLNQEILDRQNADITITNNLNQEIQDRINGDSILGDSITALDTKYTSITGALDDKIDSVEGALSDSITALDTKYNSITGALDDKIDSVEGALSDSITALDTKYDTITDNLSDSITALDTKYTSITGALDDKIDSVEGALNQSISNEVTARQNADTNLQNQITSNYNTLDDKIDSIQGALSDSITALDTKYDSITGALDDKIDSIQGALADSISALSDTVETYNTQLNDKIDSIEGGLSDSITALDTKYTSITGALDSKIDSVEGALSDSIDSLTSIVSDNYNTLDSLIGGVDDKIDTHIANKSNPHEVTKTQIGLGNVDNTSDLNKPISTATQNALDGKVPNTRTVNGKALSNNISLDYTDVNALPNTTTINDLTSTSQQNALNSGITSSLVQQISTNQSDISDLTTIVSGNYTTLDNRITNEVSTLNTSISNEETARINADTNLQSQIDAITSASDVTDIVGTYAELQAYDTTSLPDKSIIKVLQDESRNDETTYYRWVITNGTGAWNLIGEEGPYYTKSEADGTFVPQTLTINSKPLNNNITLTASDVGALPSNTVIGSGILTIQKNSSTIDTFSANATSNKTINISVPVDTGDLTNNAGYIKGITSSDVISALGYTPYNSSNPNGYISGITSSDVTTALGYTPYNSSNPNGYISGISSSDVISALGYTPYNSSNPNGYTSNIGTVTSINNISPDANGNVTLSIPTVGNGTITINQGGTQKGTFTTNQSGNTTINLDAGGSVITNPLSISKEDNGVTYTYTIGFNANNRYYSQISINDGTDTTTTQIPSLYSILNGGALNINTSTTSSNPLETTKTFTIGVNVDDSTIKINNNGKLYFNNSAGYISSIPSTYLQNTATGTNSLTILGNASSISSAVNIGYSSSSLSDNTVTLGYNSLAGMADNSAPYSTALGSNAVSTGSSSIQLGYGTNSTTNSLSVGFYNNSTTHYNWTLLDGTTGLIPDARLSSSFLKNLSYYPNESVSILNSSHAGGSVNIGYGTAIEYKGVAIGYNCAAMGEGSVSIGYNANVYLNKSNSISIGSSSSCDGSRSIAIGAGAQIVTPEESTSTKSSIQLGYGINSTSNTFNVGFYNNSTTHYNWTLLDGTTGLIPDARLSSNIARTTDIPSLTNYVTTDTVQNITAEKTFVGNKLLKFKGVNASSKLGFTAFDSSNREVGYLECQGQGNASHKCRLGIYDTTNTNYDNVLGFEYYKGKGSDGSIHRYNLLCPPLYPSTTDTNFYIPMAITDGNTTVTASNTGSVDISSLLPTIPTVDQTYDGTSANAQSGVAIEGELSTNYVKSSAEDTLQGITSSIGYDNGSPVMQTIYSDYQFMCGCGSGGAVMGAVDTSTGNAAAIVTSPTALMIAQGNQQALLTLSSNSNLVINGNEVATLNDIPDVSNFVTNTSLATTLADYVTNSVLATTLADYALLTDIPTVPTNISAFNNDTGYITGITSSDVTTALGYIPYDSTNPSGYQANVIETIKVNGTALTPTSKAVDIIVPSAVTENTVSGWGFTKNTGTVTSVNNTQPDANGNVSITIPDISTKQDTLISGTNIKTINNTSLLGSGNIDVLQNTATGTNALAILGDAFNNYSTAIGNSSVASVDYAIAIGSGATASNFYATAIGSGVTASGLGSIAIGYGATASSVDYAIQLGDGTNTTANSLQVYSYQLLDGTTGYIPSDRINAVKDQNTGSVKTWTGTLAQYTAITTKDSDTIYNITDD